MAYAYIYQLQGASAESLRATDFYIAVVDPDDTGMSVADVESITAQGKTLYSYLSIGEAESYRDYWESGNWDSNKPSFVLGENESWGGNFRVKFWDPQWQQIVFDRIASMVSLGYHGAYLDVVDVYTTAEVIAAFNADNPGGTIRDAMESFVISLSNYAKSLDPTFRIITQNAVELLSDSALNNLDDVLTPNIDYLAAIDGVGKESTFTEDNTYPIAWGPWDARFVDLALAQGKFVLAIEYPTQTSLQSIVLSEALAAGYIPFIGTRNLDGNIPAINATTIGDIDPDVLNLATYFNTLNQTLIGNTGHDNLSGDAGHDAIYGLDGNDRLTGNAGQDSLYGWYGNDELGGGEGNDYLFGDFGADTLDGGNGNDYVYGWSEHDSLNGGAGSDVLYGDAGNDTAHGGDGDDVFFGSTGSDMVYGGAGYDQLFGDEDNDQLYGEDGNDRLYGWTGNDTLVGGNGNDSISGDQGADQIESGAGHDWIYAGSENDYILMGSGNDWAFGDAGSDTIFGEAGADVIFSWTGDDSLNGGSGNDFISAEQGNDTIEGGDGNDEMYGGTGADVFIIRALPDIDTIRDFTHGEDIVRLIGFGSDASFETTLAGHIFYANGRATIVFGSVNSLNFDNIADGALSAADFQFG